MRNRLNAAARPWEQSRTLEAVRELVDRIVALLDSETYASLRRAFAVMLRTVLASARGINLGTEDMEDVFGPKYHH